MISVAFVVLVIFFPIGSQLLFFMLNWTLERAYIWPKYVSSDIKNLPAY